LHRNKEILKMVNFVQACLHKMKVSGKTGFSNLLNLTVSLRENRSAHDYASDEPPLRSEMFSADQMEQHGKSLAASHQLTPERAPDRLLTRLAENESLLIGACDLLTAAVTANRRITPAGEWLLDNFYLIEEQIRTAKRHLPKGYSRELPRLAHGPSAGLPRVYDIALETIAHGDGRVGPESLRRFVASYQTVTALTLGELWAIPIMLRLALIENLRRVAARSAAGRIDRNLADSWIDQMIEVAEKDPKSLVLAEPGFGVAADLDRAAAVRVRPDDRAAGAVGKPATGRRPGLHQQQHRQSPIPGGDGLARLRRDAERCRAKTSGGSRRHLRHDEFFHP
jgi:hypothetical protein